MTIGDIYDGADRRYWFALGFFLVMLAARVMA